MQPLFLREQGLPSCCDIFVILSGCVSVILSGVAAFLGAIINRPRIDASRLCVFVILSEAAERRAVEGSHAA